MGTFFCFGVVGRFADFWGGRWGCKLEEDRGEGVGGGGWWMGDGDGV